MGFNAGGSYVTSASGQGDRNTFVGRAAGFALTNGRHNTMVGCDAGLILATGNSNTFIGEHAGYRQISGDNNVFIGSHAGQGPGAGGTGENNTFVGTFCGPSNLNGDNNTMMGFRAGSNCNTGERNCFYGWRSGNATLNGNENVFLGFRSGQFNVDGNNNCFVGTDAGVPTPVVYQNLNNANAIGFNAKATANNQLILGNNAVNVGIGLSDDQNNSGPQNKLEIDAGLNGMDAQPNGSFGASGLRFRDLHLGNVASIANGYCLSVNPSGDVILVQDQTGPFGAVCAAPTVINQESAVDLNGNMFHFLGTASNSRVGIGTQCGNANLAKLSVEQQPSAGQGRIGIAVVNFEQSINPGNTVFGIVSVCFPPAPSFTDHGYTAGFFRAHGSKRNVGVEGFADGLAANGTANYGGYFSAINGGTNVGVYGEAPVNGTDWAGLFNGDVNVLGGYFLNGVSFASDENFKTNVDSIANAMTLIEQIQPKTYYFDTTTYPTMHFSASRQYGMIAQEVAPIMPELVDQVTTPTIYDTLGNVVAPSYTYLTLNYNSFIALLIAGMQEQQTQIDRLQSQINSCCSYSSRMSNNTNQQDVTLTDTKSIVLNQNVPNPFAEQTTISFLLPESVVKAQMLFYDAQGKLIKAVDLEGRGEGQLNVFADDLSNGVYSYALVADGEVIDTKQMVKTK